MGKWEEEYRDENFQWSDLLKIFEKDPDKVSLKDVNIGLKDLKKIPKEDRTKKDYYDTLGLINKFEGQVPSIDILGAPVDFWGKDRAQLRDQMDDLFPDRGKGTKFDQFTKAYAEKDPEKKEKMLDRLRTQYDPKQRSPHIEKGRPFVESDVTEAILEGTLKKPEAPYTGPFGKLGEHFSKNAAARDKLFQYLGSMGREFVKPIEPGKEAAGALVPTLSRGLRKGEEGYAAKQAAAAKTALDMATARQKINPLQYYSSKMQEARLAVPQGTDPDSAEGKRWIGKYLLSVGIPGQVVDLTSSLESLNIQKLSAQDDTERKRLQDLIDKINRQIQDLVSQSIGGSSVTNIIPYSPT